MQHIHNQLFWFNKSAIYISCDFRTRVRAILSNVIPLVGVLVAKTIAVPVGGNYFHRLSVERIKFEHNVLELWRHGGLPDRIFNFHFYLYCCHIIADNY